MSLCTDTLRSWGVEPDPLNVLQQDRQLHVRSPGPGFEPENKPTTNTQDIVGPLPQRPVSTNQLCETLKLREYVCSKVGRASAHMAPMGGRFHIQRDQASDESMGKRCSRAEGGTRTMWRQWPVKGRRCLGGLPTNTLLTCFVVLHVRSTARKCRGRAASARLKRWPVDGAGSAV